MRRGILASQKGSESQLQGESPRCPTILVSNAYGSTFQVPTPAYDTISISPVMSEPRVDQVCESVSNEQMPLHSAEPAEVKEPATTTEVKLSEMLVRERTTGCPDEAAIHPLANHPSKPNQPEHPPVSPETSVSQLWSDRSYTAKLSPVTPSKVNSPPTYNFDPTTNKDLTTPSI